MPLPKREKSGLTLLEGQALDLLAAGKTPREIGSTLGISPGEAAKLSYNLLDKEIITDVEQRRKLQVYRLEKIISALWDRVQRTGDRDDVRNLTDVIDKLNVLLGLNKEQDAALELKMHQYQLEAYMRVLLQLMEKFMQLAPQLMTPEEWQTFFSKELETAKTLMIAESEQD